MVRGSVVPGMGSWAARRRPLPRSVAFGLVLLALLVVTVARARAEDPARTLAGLRGKHRVLLVFAPSNRDASFLTQRRLWEPEQAGFADRDLVTLPMFATARRNTPLTGKYHVRPEAFTVVLLGKDGNEAFRSERPVPAAELYARIDAMPMRREEIRQRGGGTLAPAGR